MRSRCRRCAALLVSVGVGLVFSLTSAVADQGTVAVTYRFSRPELGSVGEYVRVKVNGCRAFQRPGKPVVPFRTARILLPPGAGVTGVRATPLAKPRVLRSPGLVEFGRMPVPIGADWKEQVETGPDRALYGSTRPYPAVRAELASVQTMCGYRIAIVRVFPVQYVPATGRLLFCPKVRVEVAVALPGPERRADRMLRTDETHARRVRDFVDNPQAADAYTALKGDAAQQVSYDYLLITTSALLPAFQPLLDQKVADGLSVTTETVENILSSYPGVDDAEKLRNFIIEAYANWGISYVLLGGDIFTVPYRGAYGYVVTTNGPVEEDGMPCDLYFACLDGTWVDLLGEVFVGRAPVDTVSEAETFVGKLLSYEQNPHPNPVRAQFLAEDLGSGDQGGDALDFLLPNFAGWDVNWLDDRSSYWATSDCLDALNYPPHIVAHDGHANETYAMRLYVPDLDSLTNESPFLVSSVGCHSGAFDHEDCIAEELVKRHQYGAFAVLMNSRYGWYAMGAEWLFSGEFQERFFYELLEQGHINVGDANLRSKHDMVGNVEASGSMPYRWCYYEVNLLGDPHAPLNLTVPPGVHHFQWSSISSPQQPDVPFAVTLTAKDAANQTETEFTGTAALTAWAADGPVLFSADFESGLDGFTVDNDYGAGNGLWHRSTGRSSDPGHSAVYSLYYGQNEGPDGGGDYDAGDTEGAVTSPLIDLTGAVPPITLHFNYFLETEGWPPDYDMAWVEVSRDGGPFAVVASNGAGGTTSLTDPSVAWESAVVDLSSCAGSLVQVRFRFATGDDYDNHFEGWYVDDVTVTGGRPVSPTAYGPGT